MEKIAEFQGEYRWLSNFAPCEITFRGVKYGSVEHAYQSAKIDDPEWVASCSDPTNSAGWIKRRANKRKAEWRDDWDEVKDKIMADLIHQKYTQEPYCSLLKSTGSMIIQEGNFHGDMYWGICLKTGIGKNKLGILIMQERDNAEWM